MLVMQFLLDHYVPESVVRVLQSRGHVVHRVRDILLPDSPDPLIATVSEQNDWILVSADLDFNKIAPRIPVGSKARFRRLSRISLECSEYQAAKRLQHYIDYIEFEYRRLLETGGGPMCIVIQNNGFKIIG